MNPEQITRQEFLFLSGPEKILFYVLAFASLAFAGWQIWQRSRLWMSGKPVPWSEATKGIPSQKEIARWLTNIGTYVVGQRKVRSSRQKSGAPMHLLLFYGFLTLLVGTTLLAINTYSPVKFHYGIYYVIYEQALDWMGLVFLTGVGWAFFRRLRMSQSELGEARLKSEDPAQQEKQRQDGRRRPMSHSLNDYLTLGLLFTVGLTGFLLEAARIAAHPQSFDSYTSPIGYALAALFGNLGPVGYRLVWWFHMVWIYVFFAVFPRMRLRHIVMAVASTAGKPNQPMGELLPISLEEVEQTGQIGDASQGLQPVAPDVPRCVHGVRTLHRSVPGLECGQGSQSQAGGARRSRLDGIGIQCSSCDQRGIPLGLHDLQRLCGGVPSPDPPRRPYC